MKAKKLNLVGRVLLAFAALFGGSKIVNAGGLYLSCNPESAISSSDVDLRHITGATEGWDTNHDAVSPDPPGGPYIDFYSKVSFSPYELMKDSRPPTSMTTVTKEISGRGLTGNENVEISALMWSPDDQSNMDDKKVIERLSQRVDDGQGGYKYVFIRNYDCWNMHYSGQTIPLAVSNGIQDGPDFYPSHKLETKFYTTNIADFDNDGKVDFKDWAILGNEYKEIMPGNFRSDVNGPDGHSDGFVDLYDVREFSDNWLD